MEAVGPAAAHRALRALLATAATVGPMMHRRVAASVIRLNVGKRLLPWAPTLLLRPVRPLAPWEARSPLEPYIHDEDSYAFRLLRMRLALQRARLATFLLALARATAGALPGSLLELHLLPLVYLDED